MIDREMMTEYLGLWTQLARALMQVGKVSVLVCALPFLIGFVSVARFFNPQLGFFK